MTKAPYIVYTPDEDFVLNKDDVNGGGGGSGESNIMLIRTTFDSEHFVYIPIDTTYEDVVENIGKKEIIVVCEDSYMRFSSILVNNEFQPIDSLLFTGFSNVYNEETEALVEIDILTIYWFKDSGLTGLAQYPIWSND